jgi:hypothetical protein
MHSSISTITNEVKLLLLLLASLVAHSVHVIPTIFDTIFRRVEPHRDRERRAVEICLIGLNVPTR